MVQVDHDEEPLYAICGTMLAESEELMAFTMTLALLIVFGEEEEDSFDQRRHTRISGYMWKLLTDCAEKEWSGTWTCSV